MTDQGIDIGPWIGEFVERSEQRVVMIYHHQDEPERVLQITATDNGTDPPTSEIALEMEDEDAEFFKPLLGLMMYHMAKDGKITGDAYRDWSE